MCYNTFDTYGGIMAKPIDLIGKKFGKLKVLKVSDIRLWGRFRAWECQCDCGNITNVITNYLLSGHTKSCGCLRSSGAQRKTQRDITGERFNKLTVIKMTNERYFNNVLWECQCDCGNIKKIPYKNIVNGLTKSCGCLQRGGISFVYTPLSEERGFKMVFSSIKKAADKRKIPFDLTSEEVENIIKQPCAYCGVELFNVKRDLKQKGEYRYNGIDRVDNSKGYTIENSVPCCGKCNKKKNSDTLKEFKEWVKCVYEYMYKDIELE